jgi:catechol 2,3-dioxygenase-like lactoylglutathione lyase family enzyme
VTTSVRSEREGVAVSGVSELVLEVVDLEAALVFYRDVLGLPVVARHEERAWLMAGTRTRIGLWTPQVGIARGRGGLHVHFAMHVDDADFDAAVVRLTGHGHPPEIVAFEDDGRGRAACVEDPDGNVVELWTWDVVGHLS